jgi:hypothetical protein
MDDRRAFKRLMYTPRGTDRQERYTNRSIWRAAGKSSGEDGPSVRGGLHLQREVEHKPPRRIAVTGDDFAFIVLQAKLLGLFEGMRDRLVVVSNETKQHFCAYRNGNAGSRRVSSLRLSRTEADWRVGRQRGAGARQVTSLKPTCRRRRRSRCGTGGSRFSAAI